MAYTNTWNENVPTDNDAANTIDDLFRTQKLDLRERMNVLVTDWSTDPIVPLQSAYGAKTSKKLIIHGTAFQRDVGTINYGDDGTESNSSTEPLRAAVMLPNGVTITGIRWLLTNGDTATTTLQFLSMDFSVGAAVEVLSDASSATLGGHIASAVISYTTEEAKAYFLKADRSGGSEFTIHAVEITYDTPDSRATI